jgi:hypothetical protein
MSSRISLVAAFCCFACGSNASSSLDAGSDAGSDAGPIQDGAVAVGPGCFAGDAGTTSRSYVVSAVTLPDSGTQFAFDLNEDGTPDNEFGTVLQELGGQGFSPQADVTASIASGASILLITQTSTDPNFQQTGCVSSMVQPGLATASPDFSGNGSFALDTSVAQATLTGDITDGFTVSFAGAEEQKTTTNPLTVKLGLFGNTLALPLVDPQISYSIGSGGLTNGVINGAVLTKDLEVFYVSIAAGLNAQIAADPGSSSSKTELALFDNGGGADPGCDSSCKNPDDSCAVPHDGRIDPCEISTNSAISSIFAPDVQLFSGTTFSPGKGAPDSLSLGFGFTAVSATVH